MKIFGLAGKAGSGKDTAYLLLKDHFESQGLKTTKISFAGKLKDICCVMFGWDRVRLDDDVVYKEGGLVDGDMDRACILLGMSRREVMQKVGTEAMRQGFHPNTWIITKMLEIERGEYDQYDVGFLTDCRFLNEMNFVRDMNGSLIQIERQNLDSNGNILGSGTLTEHTSHLSELEWTQWTDWDAIVPNIVQDGVSRETSLANLKNSLIKVVTPLINVEEAA